MKQAYNLLLLLLCAIFCMSCQEDMDLQGSDGTGYLLLTINGSNETTTRAATLPEGYTGRQIAVEIINAKDSVVQKTDDWENWKDHPIKLPVGQYTIKAYSYGFDGKQSAMAAPYYYGSKTINIEKDKELREKVTCKLANVKMSVKIADELKEAFKSFTIYVTSKEAGKCDPIYFNIDLSAAAIKDTAYFPATDLVVKYAATNQDGKKNEATRDLTGVKGNDHYILNFTLGKAENGNGDVTVEVDETLHTYEYTFTVSQTPTNGAITTTGTWDKVAYLKAENVTAGSGVSLEGIKFQYREISTTQTKASEENENPWIDVVTTEKDGVYTAFITGLNPATKYEYRLVNSEAVEIQTPQSFTTEEASEEETNQEILQNAGFEDWYLLEAKLGFLGGDSKTWYPCSKDYYTKNGESFWDSSNPGTTQGMGSMSGGLNPTQGTTEIVHSGSYAAKLETQWAILKLAAASIYTGKFNSLVGANGAKIDFGQPFTSRPISLKGWYQYKPEVIDDDTQEVGNSGVLKNGDTDQCSIYIILAKGTHQVDNTNTKTLLTAENVKADDNFIAYGELPVEQCVSTNGEWKEFNIPLKYKEDQFGEKPTHLIIVCSSSKYGDYFTGAIGSTLYLDDFELVYDGTPAIWE